MNLTVGYTGSQGRDMFLRGVANTFDNVDPRAAGARRSARSTTRPPAASTAWSSTATRSRGCGEASYNALQIGADAAASAPASPAACSTSTRATRARRRDRTKRRPPSNTFDYNTEFGAQPERHPAHVQRLARSTCCRSTGRWAGGWRVGGIVNARSGVPINVTINRPDTVTVGGVDGHQHPRRQHAAARSARISCPAWTRI